jgi:hypothetical protein
VDGARNPPDRTGRMGQRDVPPRRRHVGPGPESSAVRGAARQGASIVAGVRSAPAAPAAPFRRLTASTVAAFPDCPPYAGAIPDPIPHLTVADGVDATTADALDTKVRPGVPITAALSVSRYSPRTPPDGGSSSATGRSAEQIPCSLARSSTMTPVRHIGLLSVGIRKRARTERLRDVSDIRAR